MNNTKLNNHSKSIVTVLIVLGFLIVGNYILTLKFFRADFTETKQYSISRASKDILRKLDDIVNVQVVISRNLPPNVKPVEMEVRDILAEYKAYAGKNLKISFVDPGTDDAEKQRVSQLGIQEVQMQVFEKDKAQVVNGFFGLAVLYADKKEVMPVIQSTENFEYDLTQAILKVVRKETPTVGILKTDTLPNVPPQFRNQMDMSASTEEKYKAVFENLRKTYVDKVVTVDLKRAGSSVNADVKTLIIPGGDSFSERELYEIDQYFMRGGNLIVLVDAMKPNLDQTLTATPIYSGITRLLEHYGAKVANDLVLDASCGAVQVPQRIGQFQMNVSVPYPYFVQITPQGINQKNPAVSAIREPLTFPWTSSVSLTVPADESTKPGDTLGVKGSILISSSPRSWVTTSGFNLDPRQKGWGPADNKFAPSGICAYLHGNFKSYYTGKPVPTGDTSAAAMLAAQNEQSKFVESNNGRHLIVVSNAMFLSSNYTGGGNMTWLLNTTDWLTLSDNLISIRSRTPKNRTINQDLISQGSAKPAIIRWVNILLMPIVLIIIGLFISIKRRNINRVTSTSNDSSGAKK